MPNGTTDQILRQDEETQRRLLLQAAREFSPNMFNGLAKDQPTIGEFHKSMLEEMWLCVIGGFCLFFPWLLLPFLMVPKARLRGYLRQNWRRLLRDKDPECEHLILTGEIRRSLKTLPRSERKRLKEVGQELDRTQAVYADLSAKRAQIQSSLIASERYDVDSARADLLLRIAREADSVTLSSLERQLEAIEGQRKAHEALRTWSSRLEAAQQECTQGLVHLRSQLALRIAAGDMQSADAATEAAATVHQINASLTAAHDASEEVLRLSI